LFQIISFLILLPDFCINAAARVTNSKPISHFIYSKIPTFGDPCFHHHYFLMMEAEYASVRFYIFSEVLLEAMQKDTLIILTSTLVNTVNHKRKHSNKQY